MADYLNATVVTPPLPAAALSAADRLLLNLLFQSERIGDDALHYTAKDGMTFEDDCDAAIVRIAIERSPPGFARDLLESASRDASETVPIDLAGSWERLLQDIVRRSPDLDHVVVVSAFTCTALRADGFGGAATVITAGHIDSISTFEFVDLVLAARLPARP